MTWIVEHADGTLTQHEAEPGTAGIDPGERYAATPRLLDQVLERWDWSAGEIVAELDAWRVRLLDEVDRQREAARLPYLTALIGQSYVYAAKGREADLYAALSPAELDALDGAELGPRFPLATAEAEVTGDSLATVIARYAAGQAASAAAIARIEALATHAKAAIRGAEDLPTMQAAAAVDWS